MEVFQELRTAPIPNVAPGAGRMHAKLMGHDLQPPNVQNAVSCWSVGWMGDVTGCHTNIDTLSFADLDSISLKLLIIHPPLNAGNGHLCDHLSGWPWCRILKTHHSSLQFWSLNQKSSLTTWHDSMELQSYRAIKMARIALWSASFLDAI